MADVAFLEALAANSQKVITLVDVHRPNGTVVPNLPMLGGSVDVDGTAAIRRKFSGTILPVALDGSGSLVPIDGSSLLAPYGTELWPSRGLQIAGSPNLKPLGVFRLSSADVVKNGSGLALSVAGYDRSRTVQRARFEAPYAIAAGTNYADAIQELISSRVAGLAYLFTTVSAVTPALLFDEAADPWASAQTMAANIGCELFFDELGQCVLRTQPLASADDTYKYVEGEDSIVLEVDKHFDDDPGYNGVIVNGEPPGLPPVSANCFDNDPDSPTYYLGPYGRVPYFYRSQYVASVTQAASTAAAFFQRVIGGTEQVKFTAIPNPMHEANDVVKITSLTAAIDSHYILESFSIPLEVGGDMSAVTRKLRNGSPATDVPA